MGSLSWLTLPCFYLNQLNSSLKASQFYLKKTSYVYKSSLFLTSKGDVSEALLGDGSQREELPNLFPHTSSHSCSKLQVGVFYRHALWISRCASGPPRKTLFFVWEHNRHKLSLF